jgi:hypothetical protein
MDIHKPKPWRGWREFLKEYLIIVIGVLTALAAEAVVQNLHERRLSAEAREAVRGELNVDITAMSRRLPQEACVARQLDEIQAFLDRAQGGGAVAPLTTIGRPIWGIVYTQRWQAATAGGRTSLLSSEEQRAFGRVYAQLDVLTQKLVEERHVWTQLRGLAGLRRLSPEMIESQRLAVSAARDLNALIQWDLLEAKYYGRQVGVKGDARLNVRPIADQRLAAPGAIPSNCNALGAAAPDDPQGTPNGRP